MGQPADIADTEIVGDKVHVNSAKGARYNYDSTAIRPRYDHSTTDVKTGLLHCGLNKQAVREAATMCPRPCKLTFDLLTLKVVSESCVTWATSVPILVFLGLFVLDIGPLYATDMCQTRIIA